MAELLLKLVQEVNKATPWSVATWLIWLVAAIATYLFFQNMEVVIK